MRVQVHVCVCMFMYVFAYVRVFVCVCVCVQQDIATGIKCTKLKGPAFIKHSK